MDFNISHHAKDEMLRRSIPLSILESVLNSPQQVVVERESLKAYQSKIDFGGGKMFLIRAIVDDKVIPATVITVYRTSKISKYWRMS